MTTSKRTLLDIMLEKLAADTWENLREARKLSVRFGEVTITDILMFEMRRKGFLTFVQTPAQEEAKFGTDFECWIGSSNWGWTGYAVQPKRLSFRTGRFDYVGHKVASTKMRQIDILKAYAAQRGMTPKYCLYSWYDKVESSMRNCCTRQQFPEEELGCTIVHTQTIQRAISIPRWRDFPSMHADQRTVPWRCLAICPKLIRDLQSRTLSSSDLSPLLDEESIIHPELPDELNELIQQGESRVNFEAMNIGVFPEEIGYTRGFPVGRLIPKRVYILDLQAEELPQPAPLA